MTRCSVNCHFQSPACSRTVRREVVERLDHLHALVAGLGGKLEAPFMAESFLALSVIPALKITDRGLVDVERFTLVPLQI
jgi:adenine deaminase